MAEATKVQMAILPLVDDTVALLIPYESKTHIVFEGLGRDTACWKSIRLTETR